MTTQRSRDARAPLGGMATRRMSVALILTALAWCLSGVGAWAQVTEIPTKGQLRVIGLRVQFVPDAPPRDDDGEPVGTQRPATRFQAQHNSDYFREVMSRVRAYFLEVSMGQLDLVPTIQSVPVTETTWDKDEDYYGEDAAAPARTAELIQRAITLSESQIDFRQYDLVVVFHAGNGQESDFAGADPTLILSRGIRGTFTGSGKSFPAAVLQSAGEVAPAAGERLSIVGRLCMGIMSVLGQGAMRTGEGLGAAGDDSYVGYWDLMDRGWMLGERLTTSGRPDWSSPAHPNPDTKIQMGWVQPILLRDNLPGAEITQVATTGQVYRMWREGQNGQEYFLVENRQKVGFDGYLPEAGLLVWRINRALPGQLGPGQLRVSLLQADGRQDIENGDNAGDASDPFPGQLARRTLNDDTVPSLRDSNGVATGVSITEISAPGQVMTANLYVVPPMILSCRPKPNFSTESVTPTFRVSFSDAIDPASILVELDDRIVVSEANLSRYYNAATRELTYRTNQLAFGQHVIRVSVKNKTKTVTESTGNRGFRVNFRTIPAGLRMVSVPYLLAAPENTPQSVFGATAGMLARWVPSKQDYRYWPQHPEAGFYPPPDDPQNPSFALSTRPAGLGFWIKLSTDTPVRVNGDQIEDVAVRIPLSAGWNMIGSPFPFPVDWNGCQVEYQGQIKPLSEAVDAGWISGTLYTYEPGGYTWVNAPAGQLKPWEGYWVKAKVNCWLQVPPVASGVIGLGESRSRDDMALEERGRATAKEWRLRLSVSAGSESEDRYNFIGVSESARDGADSRDVEEPPAPGDGVVSLYLVEGGRRLAQDLRSAANGGEQVWNVEVALPVARQQVTLSWPDLSALPRDMDAYLEDEATGRIVAMRTRTAYSFDSGEGGVRRFRITVRPRGGSSLAITELSVMRTRGVPSVRVNISRDAMIRVEAVNPATGRRQTLVPEHQGRAGLNVISTGRSDGLSAGMHLIEVTATASDGATVRAVRPLVIVR